jgi:hypothetical protein
MRRPRLFLILLLAAPTLIAGGIALALMNWRSPSHIHLRLATDHLVFRVTGEEPRQILNSVAVRSITIESYSRFELNPDRGAFADTADFSASEEAAESAWKPLSLTPPVVITSGQSSLQPSITVESAQRGAGTAGTLDQVWAKPGTLVTVDTADPAALRAAIKLTGQRAVAVLSLPNPFNLFSDYGQASGLNLPPAQRDSQAFRFHLPSSSPQAQVTGAPSSLALFLTLPNGKLPAVFSPDDIPVDAIDLTRQGSLGRVESSIVGTSEITYPDDPKVESVTLNSTQFLAIGDLKQFRIEKIELDPSTHSLQLTAGGIAGVIRTGTAGFGQDRRLTYFDRLWHSSQLILLFSIAVWLFPTTVAGYKLYKEVAK